MTTTQQQVRCARHSRRRRHARARSRLRQRRESASLTCATRQREISVRFSMGATRWRLIRQLLTESLLLAGLGGALGLDDGALGSIAPAGAGRHSRARGLAHSDVHGGNAPCFAGIVFGIAPALRATKMDVGVALKENSRSVAASNTILSRALLIVQVSISVVLLVGAGLFLHTLDNLRRVDVGFDRREPSLRARRRRRRRLERRAQIPVPAGWHGPAAEGRGREEATLSLSNTAVGMRQRRGIFVQGRTYPGRAAAYAAERDDINRVIVGAELLRDDGHIPRRGRGFTDRDNQRAPAVAIINEAAARKFFPMRDPIGRRFG